MYVIGKKTAYNHLARKIVIFSLFVIFLFSGISAFSDVPVVRNLTYMYVASDNAIKILYNLFDSDPGTVSISFVASDDGGKTFNIVPHLVSGDIGSVLPGTGKSIKWNINADYPTLNPYTVKIRFIANDGTNNLIYVKEGGSVMLLIPGGDYTMGSITQDDGMPIYGDEMPQHTVNVDSFYMDQHEVTNAQYAIFMVATGRPAPFFWTDPRFNAPNQPVIGVTWDDAVAYCNWVGKRLPTEAEWERAAKAGYTGRHFPWGNTLDRNYGNFASVEGADVWYDTAPVCSFKPNDYGLFDIIGNVYEWCSDYYDYYYYTLSPYMNPPGPTSGDNRVLRGGSCYDGFFPSYLRSATRYGYFPTTSDGIVGFRCVLDIPK